jgi:hypothetical protein
MSDDVQKDLEKATEVVITADDCNAALDFWRHFNIPIPAMLETAMSAFSADPSYANQEEVKMQVCKAIADSQHEAFKDDMFSKIVEECKTISFDMSFDKDLEATLAEKE